MEEFKPGQEVYYPVGVYLVKSLVLEVHPTNKKVKLEVPQNWDVHHRATGITWKYISEGTLKSIQGRVGTHPSDLIIG